MDELYEAPIHHLLVESIPCQQCDLVTVQLAQCLGIQFPTNRLFDSLHKGCYKGIHALAGRLAQYAITDYHFFHHVGKGTKLL